MSESSGPEHGQIGPYRIVSRLGSGGMGEVYRASDTRLGREVAIKVLLPAVASDPERIGRFQREARVAPSLNHPNIAAIYGFENVGESHFLVMELVEGRSLADRLKALLIGGALSLAAVEIAYGLIALTPYWWLVAAGVFFVVQIALTAVVPIWIVPIFYRLSPLADAELRERLLALARRAHVDAVGVFVADQSRKSRTANAAVVGIGRTRRIIVFDTLLSSFTPEEIESVLAHELGHHVHGDIRRGLLVQGALLLVTARLAALGLDAGVPLLGLAGPADPAGLPWLALVLLALGLIQLPLGNGFSRRIERQADDFALATTGNAPAFIGAMERLAQLNLAERRPNRLKEIVFYSHPALDRRIERASTGST
jgi:STE24 endopeptidase